VLAASSAAYPLFAAGHATSNTYLWWGRVCMYGGASGWDVVRGAVVLPMTMASSLLLSRWLFLNLLAYSFCGSKR